MAEEEAMIMMKRKGASSNGKGRGHGVTEGKGIMAC